MWRDKVKDVTHGVGEGGSGSVDFSTLDKAAKQDKV